MFTKYTFFERCSSYLDGGTLAFESRDGTLFVDFRLDTKTPGAFWIGYPESHGAQRIDDPELIDVIHSRLVHFQKVVTHNVYCAIHKTKTAPFNT
jgi:hypothetical protein